MSPKPCQLFDAFTLAAATHAAITASEVCMYARACWRAVFMISARILLHYYYLAHAWRCFRTRDALHRRLPPRYRSKTLKMPQQDAGRDGQAR